MYILTCSSAILTSATALTCRTTQYSYVSHHAGYMLLTNAQARTFHFAVGSRANVKGCYFTPPEPKCGRSPECAPSSTHEPPDTAQCAGVRKARLWTSSKRWGGAKCPHPSGPSNILTVPWQQVCTNLKRPLYAVKRWVKSLVTQRPFFNRIHYGSERMWNLSWQFHHEKPQWGEPVCERRFESGTPERRSSALTAWYAVTEDGNWGPERSISGACPVANQQQPSVIYLILRSTLSS
jgi:hypothetical protein